MSIANATTLHGRGGGCHACRRMKVKCDRELPGCARCARAGRKCPGYRTEIDNFISMNDSTKQKAHSRGQRTEELSPSPSNDSLPSRSRPDVGTEYFNILNQLPQPLRALQAIEVDASPPAVVLDLETQVVQAFLGDFCDNSSMAMAWVDFLPDICNDQTVDTGFDDALKALSFMHFSQRTCMTTFMAQARNYYGKALMQVSAQLNIKDQHTNDHLLAALVLLDLYEVMAGDKPLTLAWDTHSAGQAMLLRARRQQEGQVQKASFMQRATMNFIYVKDLAQKRSPTIVDFSATENDFGTAQAESATILLSRMVGLQSEGYSLIQDALKGSVGHAKILILLRDSLAANRSCITWKASCPSAWQPQQSTFLRSLATSSPGIHSSRGHPKEIMYFVDLSVASLWCAVEAAQVRLLQTMIECTEILEMPAVQESPAFSRSTLKQRILDSIDSISSIIPYLLGEVDSSGQLCLPPIAKPRGCMQALWPLHVCAISKDIDDACFEWLATQLHRAGEVVGCRRAIELEQYRSRRFAHVNSTRHLSNTNK